jgi:hypothetical protein
MEEHRFYIVQARKRLLSQFENMEQEADSAAEEYLNRNAPHFDPDFDDLGSVYERAGNEASAFYQLLSDLRENTLLSVAAGMFHQWDKSLREWIVTEIQHWVHGEKAKAAIWKANFPQLVDFLTAFGFEVRKLPGYERMNALRLVINVYKHGRGLSYDELKSAYPEFLPHPWPQDTFSEFFDMRNYTHLKVTDQHLQLFSESILEFWRAVPEQILLTDKINAPDWFCSACNKDFQTP